MADGNEFREVEKEIHQLVEAVCRRCRGRLFPFGDEPIEIWWNTLFLRPRLFQDQSGDWTWVVSAKAVLSQSFDPKYGFASIVGNLQDEVGLIKLVETIMYSEDYVDMTKGYRQIRFLFERLLVPPSAVPGAVWLPPKLRVERMFPDIIEARDEFCRIWKKLEFDNRQDSGGPIRGNIEVILDGVRRILPAADFRELTSANNERLALYINEIDRKYQVYGATIQPTSLQRTIMMTLSLTPPMVACPYETIMRAAWPDVYSEDHESDAYRSLKGRLQKLIEKYLRHFGTGEHTLGSIIQAIPGEGYCLALPPEHHVLVVPIALSTE